jgi:type I restriction enzyme M protein
VKASLLFLQKFTEKEQAVFDRKCARARAEVEAKYADEIKAETNRLNEAIEVAKALDPERRRLLQRELSDFHKRMQESIAAESRILLKERFPYPIFLCEAEKVGITGTGETDENELFPNDNSPSGVALTSLELYQEFRLNPKRFFLTEEA